MFLFLFSLLLAIGAGLTIWTAVAEEQSHYTPDYERIDLSPLLEKEELSKDDYALLLEQTGLGEEGVKALYQEGRREELLSLQERFFTRVEIECLVDNLIVRSERLVGQENVSEKQASQAEDFLPVVESGDILVSFSGHVFGWRSGHAAIVADGEQGLTVEALTLGCESQICSIERWREYPCFALLRLKGASKEERAKIAEYAAQNLVGIPYRLLVSGGEVEKREQEAFTGTHCAHLVWLAYAKFGYDLDSDRGWIVTPRDLYESDLLEVVQVYGLDPRER